MRRDRVDGVGDALVDRALAADADALGVLEREAGDGLDLGRHGGGKEKRLPVGRAHADDLFDVVDEAHVEHAVHLVEDEDLEVVEAERALLEEVHQAADGGDHDVGAGAHVGALFAVADAAVEEGAAGVGELAKLGEGLVHLGGELAGGLEHEHAGAGGLVRAEHVEDGQGEGGGFARARLGGGDEIAPGEHGRDGLLLDGRGRGVTFGGDGADDAGMKT